MIDFAQIRTELYTAYEWVTSKRDRRKAVLQMPNQAIQQLANQTLFLPEPMFSSAFTVTDNSDTKGS
jgi:hypothetical protein